MKTERDRERDMREREGGRESIISLNEYLELKKFFDSTAHVKSGDIDLVGKNRQKKCWYTNSMSMTCRGCEGMQTWPQL